jgi:hypothetical protein
LENIPVSSPPILIDLKWLVFQSYYFIPFLTATVIINAIKKAKEEKKKEKNVNIKEQLQSCYFVLSYKLICHVKLL